MPLGAPDKGYKPKKHGKRDKHRDDKGHGGRHHDKHRR